MSKENKKIGTYSDRINKKIDHEFDKLIHEMLVCLKQDLMKLGYSRRVIKTNITEAEKRYYNLEPKQRIEKLIKYRFEKNKIKTLKK